MSVDIEVSDQGWLTGLRAALSEEFAVQTTRLKELTEISADTGDPGEAHNRAALVAATRYNLEQITGALRRIAEGGYGRCEKCDGPIPSNGSKCSHTPGSVSPASRNTTADHDRAVGGHTGDAAGVAAALNARMPAPAGRRSWRRRTGCPTGRPARSPRRGSR